MFKFFFVALLILAPQFTFAQPLKIKVKAPYAILVDVDTGKVLYSKRGDVPAHPASTTKIGTFLYALELLGDGDLDQEVTVPAECVVKMEKRVKIENDYKIAPYWLESDGMSMDLLPGEKIPLRALFVAGMLWSANDAANVVAHHFGGTIPAFVDGLNAYLQQIGCKDTHFDNPSGLHFPTHITTAHDLARMAIEARRYPILYEISRMQIFERPKTNKRPAREYSAYNKMLKEGRLYYPHATGLKTGYIENAGYCLVSTAESQERKLIAVLLKEEDKNQRYRDAITMFNAAFQEEKVSRTLYTKDETLLYREVERGASRLKTTIESDLAITYYPSMAPDVQSQTLFYQLKAPIKKGAVVGEIVVRDELGKVLAQTPLIAVEGVKEKFLFKIARSWSIWKVMWGALFVAAALFWRYRQCQIQQFLRSRQVRRLQLQALRLIKRVISLKYKTP